MPSVYLRISHKSDPLNTAPRSSLQDILDDPELKAIHDGWSLQSLEVSSPLTHLGHVVYVATINHPVATPSNVDALCNALVKLKFETLIRNFFGDIAVNYYASPDHGNEPLGSLFAVRFATATLEKYASNNFLFAQISIYQIGAMGVLERNPSKWIKGVPRAIHDTAALINSHGDNVLNMVPMAAPHVVKMVPKVGKYIPTDKEKLEEIVKVLKWSLYGTRAVELVMAQIPGTLSSNAREPLTLRTRGFIREGQNLHRALTNLQLSLNDLGVMHKCYDALHSVEDEIGAIFPLSISVMDDSFALPVAYSGLSLAGGALILFGGPLTQIAGGVVAVLGAGGAVYYVPQWWRDRALSWRILRFSSTIMSATNFLRILALRHHLATMTDTAERNRLQGLLKNQLSIDYERLNSDAYVCESLGTIAREVKEAMEDFEERFTKAKLLLPST